MRKLKRISPYIFLVFFIFLSSLIWEHIKLPFNVEKSLPGQEYLKNLHNPLNDSIRFIVFILLPLSAYFTAKFLVVKKNHKLFFKNLLINLKDSNKYLSKDKNLSNSLKFIILIILIQFFCIDFKTYIYHLDLFHEGLWLTASSNAIYKNEFWQSSYIGRGLFGNFSNYFIWKISDINSIGISRFVALFFIMLNKVFLVLISKNLVEKTFLDSNKKFCLFIVLSFFLITLSDYNLNGPYSLRSFGLLFFIYFLLKFFDNFKVGSLPLLIIGFFSSVSFFWYIDVGVYINLTIFLLIIYLLLRKEFLISASIVFYILAGWVFFYTLLPKNEFINFYKNTLSIFLTIEYIQGLIYPTPFFSGDARSTRALLLILITGIFTINLLFKLNDKISLETKLSLVFLFLIACINFKSALSRSDTGHIKAGLSIIYIPLFYHFLYSVITKISFKNINFTNKYLQILLLILFFILGLSNNTNSNFRNLPNSLNSIKYLVSQDDNKFLNQDYNDFINYYKKISINDKCIQIFTNEVAIPYLLKKPTCTKYYVVYSASPITLQKDHVSSLILKRPKYILYKSEKDLYDDPIKRLTIVNEYILKNYTFFRKFNKFTILKRK